MTPEWVVLVLQLGCAFVIGMLFMKIKLRSDALQIQEEALHAEIADFNDRFANALDLFHEGNLPAARRALLVRDQQVH